MNDMASIVETDQPPERDEGAWLVRQWSAFAAALQFLTRVPLTSQRPVSAASLGRAPVYFPLVGTMIGAVAAAALGAACLAWPVALAVVVAVAVESWLTGALHEDGVADFCDAMGGGWSRERTLEILRDSRIGTYGALGLGLALALRIGALIVLIDRVGVGQWLAWSAALVAGAALGRWMIVLVMVWVPPVADRESLTRDMGRAVGVRGLIAATLWALPAALWFALQMPLRAALAAALLAAVVVVFVRLIRRRLGGVTGDCLGCLSYLAQVVVLLAAAARVPT
jgi:adenosylcobinamide-GDP ribazoletransferase